VLGIFNSEVTPIMGFFQFMTSKFERMQKYLFNRPFRFTAKSTNKIIDYYSILSGYYETFVRIMILCSELVYEDQELPKLNYNKIFKLRFATVLEISKKIPNFGIFLTHYNKTLRNKIVHRDYSIDYVNQMVVYKNGRLTFKELLATNKEIATILLSYIWIFHFDTRVSLEKVYDQMDQWNLERLSPS